MPVKIEDTSNIQAAQERHKLTTPEAELTQLVVFSLDDESFGADINQVREIVRVGMVTPIPDSPNFIRGVANIRGEIIIVIDLKERFFLPVKKSVESKHIVITGQEGNLYGLLVDEVTEVLRIPRRDIKTTPHLITKIDRVYISGVLTLENRLIMLLDLKKVLSEEELNKLSRMVLARRGIRGKEPVSEEAEDLSGQAAEEPRPANPVRDKSLNGARAKERKGRK